MDGEMAFETLSCLFEQAARESLSERAGNEEAKKPEAVRTLAFELAELAGAGWPITALGHRRIQRTRASLQNIKLYCEDAGAQGG